MPGPLFNIAAYCGAVIAINAKVFPLIGIVICWVGVVPAHFNCIPEMMLCLSRAELYKPKHNIALLVQAGLFAPGIMLIYGESNCVP